VATPTAPALAASAVDWSALVQMLGHTATWPGHWHEALTTGGQASLLRTAAADWASTSD
jgi:hypothetical protein